MAQRRRAPGGRRRCGRKGHQAGPQRARSWDTVRFSGVVAEGTSDVRTRAPLLTDGGWRGRSNPAAGRTAGARGFRGGGPARVPQDRGRRAGPSPVRGARSRPARTAPCRRRPRRGGPASCRRLSEREVPARRTAASLAPPVGRQRSRTRQGPGSQLLPSPPRARRPGPAEVAHRRGAAQRSRVPSMGGAHSQSPRGPEPTGERTPRPRETA